LVTSPEHQRRGIGASVLTDTLRRMDALRIHELHLAVSACSDARGLYRRLGFIDAPPGVAPAA
jgi:ribosomal protein S18 acetylase RimI-like enzyme